MFSKFDFTSYVLGILTVLGGLAWTETVKIFIASLVTASTHNAILNFFVLVNVCALNVVVFLPPLATCKKSTQQLVNMFRRYPSSPDLAPDAESEPINAVVSRKPTPRYYPAHVALAWLLLSVYRLQLLHQAEASSPAAFSVVSSVQGTVVEDVVEDDNQRTVRLGAHKQQGGVLFSRSRLDFLITCWSAMVAVARTTVYWCSVVGVSCLAIVILAAISVPDKTACYCSEKSEDGDTTLVEEEEGIPQAADEDHKDASVISTPASLASPIRLLISYSQPAPLPPLDDLEELPRSVSCLAIVKSSIWVPTTEPTDVDPVSVPFADIPVARDDDAPSPADPVPVPLADIPVARDDDAPSPAGPVPVTFADIPVARDDDAPSPADPVPVPFAEVPAARDDAAPSPADPVSARVDIEDAVPAPAPIKLDPIVPAFVPAAGPTDIEDAAPIIPAFVPAAEPTDIENAAPAPAPIKLDPIVPAFVPATPVTIRTAQADIDIPSEPTVESAQERSDPETASIKPEWAPPKALSFPWARGGGCAIRITAPPPPVALNVSAPAFVPRVKAAPVESAVNKDRAASGLEASIWAPTAVAPVPVVSVKPQPVLRGARPAFWSPGGCAIRIVAPSD